DLRKLRAELSEVGLDWDSPPYPAAAGEQPIQVPQVQVHLGELEDAAVLGSQPTPQHLRTLVGVNSFVLAFQPFNFKAYRQRGRAYAGLNEARLAIADYSTALALWPADDPARAAAFGRRASNYLVLKDYDKALADIGQAERIDPSQAAACRQS